LSALKEQKFMKCTLYFTLVSALTNNFKCFRRLRD
jgi:hypothetical protein